MSDRPLFEGMDEQERALAPEQVPGAQPSPDAAEIDREAVVGAEGRDETPIVPAQPTVGAAGTATIPPTAAPDLLTERERDEPAG